jgi:hypothetical protein
MLKPNIIATVVNLDMDSKKGDVKVPHNFSMGLKITEEENFDGEKTVLMPLMDGVATGSS